MLIHRWRPPPTAGKMKKNFDFVNVTTPGDRANPEHRRQVHVQAMRSFRRQQRLQNVAAYQRANREGTVQQEEVDEEVAQNTILDQSAPVSAGVVDPFSALPPGFAEHQDLLTFFQVHIGPMLLPDSVHQPEASWSTQWLQKAIASPMMLAATCTHAAVFLDDVQGNEQSARTLQFQSQSIRSLNESLENGVGDDAIGTVLMLFANTIITGSADEMRVHMLGLERMLCMRGGQEDRDEDSLLQMGALWHVGAFHAFQKSDRQITILDVTQQPSIDAEHELSSLVADCRRLTHSRGELESAQDIDRNQLRHFSNQRSILESRLGRLRYRLQDESEDNRKPSNTLHRAMCMAALFYSFFFLRRYMMGGRFTDDMIDELVDTLANTDEAILGSNTNNSNDEREAALWATTIASRFARTAVQLEFTQRYAVKLARSFGYNSMKQWVACLDRFAWPGHAWESTVIDLIHLLPS